MAEIRRSSGGLEVGKPKPDTGDDQREPDDRPFFSGSIFAPAFVEAERSISKRYKTIVFDLDGTLAKYDKKNRRYTPIEGMLEQVEKLHKLPGIRIVLWTSATKGNADIFFRDCPKARACFDRVITIENYADNIARDMQDIWRAHGLGVSRNDLEVGNESPEIDAALKIVGFYSQFGGLAKEINLLGYDILVDDSVNLELMANQAPMGPFRCYCFNVSEQVPGLADEVMKMLGYEEFAGRLPGAEFGGDLGLIEEIIRQARIFYRRQNGSEMLKIADPRDMVDHFIGWIKARQTGRKDKSAAEGGNVEEIDRRLVRSVLDSLPPEQRPLGVLNVLALTLPDHKRVRALREDVIDREGGIRALNYLERDRYIQTDHYSKINTWTVIVLADDHKAADRNKLMKTLRHELTEIRFREDNLNASWVDAHNKACELEGRLQAKIDPLAAKDHGMAVEGNVNIIGEMRLSIYLGHYLNKDSWATDEGREKAAELARLMGREDVDKFMSLLRGNGARKDLRPEQEEALSKAVARLKEHLNIDLDRDDVLFIPPDSWLCDMLGVDLSGGEAFFNDILDGKKTRRFIVVSDIIDDPAELTETIIHEGIHAVMRRGTMRVCQSGDIGEMWLNHALQDAVATELSIRLSSAGTREVEGLLAAIKASWEWKELDDGMVSANGPQSKSVNDLMPEDLFKHGLYLEERELLRELIKEIGADGEDIIFRYLMSGDSRELGGKLGKKWEYMKDMAYMSGSYVSRGCYLLLIRDSLRSKDKEAALRVALTLAKIQTFVHVGTLVDHETFLQAKWTGLIRTFIKVITDREGEAWHDPAAIKSRLPWFLKREISDVLQKMSDHHLGGDVVSYDQAGLDAVMDDRDLETAVEKGGYRLFDTGVIGADLGDSPKQIYPGPDRSGKKKSPRIGTGNNRPIAAMEVHPNTLGKSIARLEERFDIAFRRVVLGVDEELTEEGYGVLRDDEFEYDGRYNTNVIVDGSGGLDDEWIDTVLDSGDPVFIMTGGSFGVCHLTAFEAIIGRMRARTLSGRTVKADFYFPRKDMYGLPNRLGERQELEEYFQALLENELCFAPYIDGRPLYQRMGDFKDMDVRVFLDDCVPDDLYDDWFEDEDAAASLRGYLTFAQAHAGAKLSFIGLGKDWIENCVGDHPQKRDIQQLIQRIRNYCGGKGIKFFDGSDSDVMQHIMKLKEADKTARGIVLTGEGSINAYKEMLTKMEIDLKTIMLAGVDTETNGLTQDSFIRIVEMLEILVELSVTPWMEPEALLESIRLKHPGLEFEAALTPDGLVDITRITFLPKAEPVEDYERELKVRYAVQVAA